MNVAAPTTPAVSGFSPAPAAVDESALSAERPFPGLRPYFFADREFFFGCERQTFALYRLVEHGQFMAVVGSSGSGKSSLVLAGLRRLLDEESADPGGPNWFCLDMRPGASPLSRLAQALARLSEGGSADKSARRNDSIEFRLRQSSFSLEDAITEAGGLGGRTLLLIIDQFEELFRFGLAGLGSRRGGLEDARARDEATQFVQILLDADRRRLKDVRVLITMRSDFIGECAYFNGLSEAVSATQYLVPNLTRGQLEEAILKPIEKAGGTIEPGLVERLLNDCGGELDQLPVLQHCLMRLWDRACVTCSDGGARHLTRQTYDDIGRISEALSRHADEIFRQCAGKELAVEQAFRALSELDREGRAIRRALPFNRLLAETGVAKSDLRAVLDRFRAPNCSFLVPSLSASPTLDADERIDIGHEALLRRWKTIAGRTETVDAKTGRPEPGWLKKEQLDGQRYRTLVSLLGGETGGERATLSDPIRTKGWWESLPRTPEWAERYGGKFADVKNLIDASIAAKQRSRRNFWALVIAGALIGVFTVGFVIEAVRQQQEAIDKGAMKSAKELLTRVLDDYNKGGINQSGARSLASVSENLLRDVHAQARTSGADRLWAESLDLESDLQLLSGNRVRSFEFALEAKTVALSLVKAKTNDTEALQLLFDALIRMGDALIPNALFGEAPSDSNKSENFERALGEYTDAMDAANRLLAISDTPAGEVHIISIYQKIGDVYKARKQLPEALDEYRKGLSVIETAFHKFPQNSELLRERGASNYRIAVALEVQAKWSEAADALGTAERDQKTHSLSAIRSISASNQISPQPTYAGAN